MVVFRPTRRGVVTWRGWWRSTEWEPTMSATPWTPAPGRLSFLALLTFATTIGEERVVGSLLLKIGDEVPEGSCLIVISN